MGEAANPGLSSRRRRTQRLRALQRSWDSDVESSSNECLRGPTQVDSDSEDERPLVRASLVPPDVMAALEQDICEAHHSGQSQQVMVAPADPCALGRVMGVVAVVDVSTPRGVVPGSSATQAAPHPLPTWRDEDSSDEGVHASVGATTGAACSQGPVVSV